jgi:hypothetical protein
MTYLRNTITVRQAAIGDIPELCSIEKEVWSKTNTAYFGTSEFTAMICEDSPFFLVAVKDSRICGYYYGKLVTLSKKVISLFMDAQNIDGAGCCKISHTSAGSSLYGISVVSIILWAGVTLQKAVDQKCVELGLSCAIGYSRLSGLRKYSESIGVVGFSEYKIVHWYVCESARLLKLSLSEIEFATQRKSAFDSVLPKISAPDKILAFHTRRKKCTLLKIIPNYMTDTESINYGVLLLSEFT